MGCHGVDAGALAGAAPAELDGAHAHAISAHRRQRAGAAGRRGAGDGAVDAGAVRHK